MNAPFSRRAASALIGLAAISLLASLVLALFVEAPPEVPSAGNDSFSRSALGHSGLVALLRDRGVPVGVSRYQSSLRLGDGDVLVVLEPRSGEALRDLLEYVDAAIVVLPKREGVPDPARPGWVSGSRLLPAEVPGEVLDLAIVRPATLRLDVNATGLLPTLAEPQLLRSDTMRALVSGPDGVLAGVDETDDHRWLVISDPDLIANHGLARGDNAALVLALIDDFRAGGRLLVDETVHGHTLEPSVWKELGRFPLSLVTLSAALVLAALLWSASRRFGPPVAAPPALAPGKQFLVDNTAALLAFGGHSAESLARYHQACLADVAKALHARPEDVPALARGRELPAELDPEVLAREVASAPKPARALAIAVRLHRFRQEMIHGSTSHRRAQG